MRLLFVLLYIWFLFYHKRLLIVKRIILFVSLLLFVVVMMAQTVKINVSQQIEERSGKQYYVHTVEKGQTVYSIAKAYNVSVDEIYFENPTSRNGISINQQLYIPTINKETEVRQEIKDADFEFFYHVCTKGETFEDIAEIYLQDADKIRRANPSSRSPFLEGEYLKIPVEIPESVIRAEFPPEALNVKHQSKPTSTKRKANTVSFNPNIAVVTDYRHIVVEGETTAGIAKKYSVDINDLKAVNPGLGDYVEKGERLRVPANATFEGQGTNAIKTTGETVVVTESEPVKEVASDKPKPQDDGFVMHTVKKKETVYRISRDYGVTLQDIYDANPGLSESIKTGQVIKVPKKKISNNYIIFEASKKTKLKKIAKLYGIPVSVLERLNPNAEKFVYRGQDVKIPVGRKAIIVSEDELKDETEKPSDDQVVEKEVDKQVCAKQEISHRQIRIALMVPLFLEDLLDEEKMDDLSRGKAQGFLPFSFVNFVEGALLAVDSLRSMGIDVQLDIYDVDKSITKTAKVLQVPGLKNVDLIIGPFYQQSFHQVALFAGNFGIPIVNPLSYREEILSNYKTAIKVKPTESTQLPLLEKMIMNKSGAKVFLITKTSYKDADRVIEIENLLKTAVTPTAEVSNRDLFNYATEVAMRDEEWQRGDLLYPYMFEGKSIDPLVLKDKLDESTVFDNSLVRINYLPQGFDTFMQQASALRENVVVLYGRDKAFVMDVVNKLNEFRDSLNISLIGIPNWARFKNLDLVQINNLNALVPESGFVDYDDYATQEFVKKFMQEYSTDPGKYGFLGYDLSWYFVNAIATYGKDFTKCLPYFKANTLSGELRFRKPFEGNNCFENTHWDVIQYRNLKANKIDLQY